MPEGPQKDNSQPLGGGFSSVDSSQFMPASRDANDEGLNKVRSAADLAREEALNSAEREKEATVNFYENKLTQRTRLAIVSLGVSVLLSLGTGVFVSRFIGNAPSQALIDSDKKINGLNTQVAIQRVTESDLVNKLNAVSKSYNTVLGEKDKVGQDLNLCLKDKDSGNKIIGGLANEVDNKNATITSLNATNVDLSARVYELTSTAQLTATDFISRMAEALRNGDQETINWLNTVGCVAPTETPSPISTTIVLPTSTATATPTPSPSSTPTIVFTPENPTNTPSLPTSTPEDTKSAPTRIPPYTPTPNSTPIPTFTPNPTMTPRPTDTTVPPTGTPDAGTKVPPTRIPVVTFTPRPEYN